MGLDYVDIFYHHRCDPETPIEESMRETGFETFLAIKLLDKSLSELDVLLDFDNWRLVMGDSDAF